MGVMDWRRMCQGRSSCGWTQVAVLGSIGAHYMLGDMYYNGNGAEEDKPSGVHQFQLAAMKGDAISRFCLGLVC